MLFLLSCNMSSHIPPVSLQARADLPNHESILDDQCRPSLRYTMYGSQERKRKRPGIDFPSTTHPGCKSASLSSSEGGSSN